MAEDPKPPLVPLDCEPASAARRERRHRWIARVALLLVVLPIVGLLVCWLGETRDGAGHNRAYCASGLRQLGVAMQTYANNNDGHFPDSFADLIAANELPPGLFVCPSSRTDTPAKGATRAALLADFAMPGHCSYIYLGKGLTDESVTATTVVAYEPPSNHGGQGANILFGDGHVAWVTAAGLQQYLAATRPATAPSSAGKEPR